MINRDMINTIFMPLQCNISWTILHVEKKIDEYRGLLINIGLKNWEFYNLCWNSLLHLFYRSEILLSVILLVHLWTVVVKRTWRVYTNNECSPGRLQWREIILKRRSRVWPELCMKQWWNVTFTWYYSQNVVILDCRHSYQLARVFV